jgi:hypothetical protein
MFLDKSGQDNFDFERVGNLTDWRTKGVGIIGRITAINATASDWNFSVGSSSGLFERLSQIPVKLADVADRIFQGLVTGCDPVFILRNNGNGRYYSEATGTEYEIETQLMHPLCKGSVNIRRYSINELEKSILFPYKLVNGKAVLLTKQEMVSQYPTAWEYLVENRKKLEAREHGKWKHAQWYAFGRSQNLSEMEQKKILTPSIAKIASFTLDIDNYFYFVGSGGGGGGGYGITLKPGEQLAYEYILGLLNSRVLDCYLKSFSSPFSGGYFAYNRQYIEKLPIRTIDFLNPSDKSCHDQVVVLVTLMLALHKQSAITPQEKELLQRGIEATDAQIDAIVYSLYGLTDAEIRIVKGEA